MNINMVKTQSILICFFVILLQIPCKSQEIKVNYVNSFQKINHPEVAYWFFTNNMLPEQYYKAEIATFAKSSKYTLIFLLQPLMGAIFMT
jgi:hypothetical protein